METAAQFCTRLVGALEELFASESVLVEAGDFSGVAKVQERARPLVLELAARAGEADLLLRERVYEVIAVRTRTQQSIEAQLTATAARLSGNATTQQRVSRVAPAYGQIGERDELRWRGQA